MSWDPQWAEQEVIFLQQLSGEISYRDSWGRHEDIIKKYNKTNVEEFIMIYLYEGLGCIFSINVSLSIQ